MDPGSDDEGREAGVGGGRVCGPSRSRDVEPVDLLDGAGRGGGGDCGPSRSSDVEPVDLLECAGADGAGLDRSSGVLAAAATPRAAGAGCGADRSSEDDLAAAADRDDVSDRAEPPERGE